MRRLIKGGRVLLEGSLQLLKADILTDDDRIASIESDIPEQSGVEIIDASDHIVIPGLINAHTHSHNNLTKGVADNWTLEDLLNNGPALLTGRTPEEHYVSAALGAIEMLRTGCTSAYDLFMALPALTEESVDAVVQAYIDSGMRATLAPAVSDRVFYETVPDLLDLLPADLASMVRSIEAQPATGLLAMMESHIRRWHGAEQGRIQTAVAPTIPGQCTDDFLQRSTALADEYGVGFHTHLAESKVQIVYADQRWGQSPLAYLDSIGAVSSRFVGAHGVWLSDDDMTLLAVRDGSIAHNPMSNLKLGSGIAPIRELLGHGVNVALGTDGSTCSDNQSVFGSMHLAATIGSVRFPHEPVHWISAAETMQMSTSNGAKALGMADDLGEISVGRKADLALLDASSIYLTPLNDLARAMVYVETGASVCTVLVDGRVVFRDGRVLGIDESQIQARAVQAAERILTGNQNERDFARSIAPYLSQACRAAVAHPTTMNRYAAPAGQSPACGCKNH